MFNFLSIFNFFNALQFILRASCQDSGIIIDTDIGGDDAMAISLLIQKQKMEGSGYWGPLLALTTTNGNTGAVNATRNAHILLETLQLNVPVIQGGEAALTRYIQPTYFFGFDGFGDFQMPIKTNIPTVPIQAPFYLANAVNTHPGKITLLFIGSLTNLALALHINPKLVEQSRRIVILGGVYQGSGNMPNMPGVEANMYSDPDAASFFFRQYSTIDKVTVIPIEAVKTMPYTMEYRLKEIGGISGRLMALLNKGEHVGNINSGKTWYGYDQSAASILIDPRVIINSTQAKLSVVTEGPRGAMFAELESDRPNANIITKFDQQIFTQLLFKYLKS